MKKLLFLSFSITFFFSLQIKAQTPFNTIDSVDINNINASILVHGDMWFNPTDTYAHCYFPSGGTKSVQFAGSLWFSGFDDAEQLHVTAQTFRTEGVDYWPGPLDANAHINYATSQKWARIWKVNRTDIQEFLEHKTHTLNNTPQTILIWPAKGNIYAQGNAGAALAVNEDMAPFIDLNGNGIYEPLLGEYPNVPGDQALWWIFSDNGPSRNPTHSYPFGIEVKAMAYAYKRGSLIDNVIYYDYTVINKSANVYHNFRIGQWDDVDIGVEADDFVGFDSVWRMGIGYNGTTNDTDWAGHHKIGYGTDPPQSAVTMIVMPGDTGINVVPAGSFMYYNGDASVIGTPTNDTQCYYYMHSMIKNGSLVANALGASIIGPCGGYPPSIRYVFPGDPSDTSAWSECYCKYYPGDQRLIITSDDLTFIPGEKLHIVSALLATDSVGGCPVTNFDRMRILADTAWRIYHNPLPPLPLYGDGNITVHLYPNPSHNIVYIGTKGKNLDDATIQIYNAIGQHMPIPVNFNGYKMELDVSRLAAGLYLASYRNGNVHFNLKFLKE